MLRFILNQIPLARSWRHAGLFALIACATSLTASAAWNDPYPSSESGKNIFYSSFVERPKTLDPARSYNADEAVFIGQIYEPPFQYDYLKRPYTLEPLTAVAMPTPVYLDKAGRRLPANVDAARVAYSIYDIRIRPCILYQPHPAFALDANGHHRYLRLTRAQIARIGHLSDLAAGTRELVADDYVHEIKRLAHPALHSPILGLMSEYIVGLRGYAKTLRAAYARQGDRGYLDLERYPLRGVQTLGRYTFRIVLHGKYPQFLYWMAMTFFAPMPPEADRFFSQPGMAERNFTLDWRAVGTGPFMLTVNDPNLKMVLARNPNFHGERYPSTGGAGDRAQGLLADAGKPLPFIDEAVFSLEKESIPRWNKFLQGYYDVSGVARESFDQVVRTGSGGQLGLSEDMRRRGIRLRTQVETSVFYYGFNMLDPVVGGMSERARKLRLAISIALDTEEQIAIFMNGRGVAAQGPLPPGIFGYVGGRAGIDPYVYDWVDGRPKRKPIAVARKLLAEAGYPNGRDAHTGKPLILYYDVTATGPEDQARLEWLTKQFAKLNIGLVIRNTDYNRFQDKMRRGNAQIFAWGWNADYPDPENFLFLLYGPNGKVRSGGENAANYENPEFDRLFERIKSMDNTPERFALIRKMVAIAQHDSPWVWGVNPTQFVLYQSWVHNAKPNLMANNTLKYLRIDPQERERLRARWNRPIVWPLLIALAVFVAAITPAVIAYRRRERRTD